ncbi:unnamed protein product [Rotaria sp. Silwood1]|nr:unnamed protein product [Rotaria sp. Silwood1]CAF1193536.1 unnamed protein product [Rotaria sp. Silwood1]CAF3492165.1 unnamed protein product [Rotaria sp. Silwood1]CAF3505469.1 unnamed protein product [Rotaria sp. Silwood1]CAF4564321.1 unnamed protein product [Rotaria sp. Silwood1]
MLTKLNIPCVWGGHLAGILLRNHAALSVKKPTKKIIGVHGWLDNLNSLLPIAERLIDRNPNYEIYLYDRSGHGFSSHLPKGSDYSYAYGLRDLRIVAQTLGWNKEKYSLLGHSYGAHISFAYAASYPEEISCLVAFDSIIGGEFASNPLWKNTATRIDKSIAYYNQPPKSYQTELTYEKAIELVKSSRLGIDDESAKLLVERSVRRDEHNKLYFTRDEALRNLQLLPFSQHSAEEAIKVIQASILFIGTIKPRWPASKRSLELLKEHNPNFEMQLIDGPHHFHMTKADETVEHVDRYLNKYLK